MTGFLAESLFTGVKEAAKLGLCAALVLGWFRHKDREFLKLPFFAGLAFAFAASLGVMASDVTAEFRDFAGRMIGYTFGLFYLLSLGALFHVSGTDLLGPLRSVMQRRTVQAVLTAVLTVAYFAPDMAGTSLYVADLYAMSDGRFSVFMAGGAGFCLGLAGAWIVLRRRALPLMRLFELPQIFLFLALIKLAAGGVRGFAELSLIPAVQAGLMKFVHDVVHHIFVMLMVPDHPVLSVSAWNFIAVLFGADAGLWLSLVLLLLPLLFFLRRHFTEEAQVPVGLLTPASRRKVIKAFRDDRLLKSLPVFAFMAVIVATWFAEKGEAGSALYTPAPRPLVAEGNVVNVPIQSPVEDLRDGRIHKYSVTVSGQERRLLIMKRPDGALAVCLDACEICRPDGYGQGKEHVICIYCNTPIPFETLGKPGGCNPIPLDALVTDKVVRIATSEIARKWELVNSSRSIGEGAR